MLKLISQQTGATVSSWGVQPSLWNWAVVDEQKRIVWTSAQTLELFPIGRPIGWNK